MTAPKKLLFQAMLILSLAGYFHLAFAGERADLIVAQDGSGDFTTIQAAIDAAPSDATKHFIVLIKKGTYNEKLFIEKTYIALVGEDRDSTTVVISLLRDDWRIDHPDDWGVATINIGSTVTNLVLANLTVKNNFAELYPDDPRKTSHCMAIRGGGDRVIIVNCNVITGGGDTLSLWSHGYYYHKDCYFEGGVDYVCPRGWCYIADSDFFGYNSGASIWHDGSLDPDEKFVIRNSRFDGVRFFGLGRHHLDAQFYLLGCTLSENVSNNGGILKAGAEPLRYGERNYYYDIHREGGDFDWHQDNIFNAAGPPAPERMTAAWTFRNEWDPEASMPSVLPFANMPKPDNDRIKVGLTPTLTWIAGRNAVSHNVYFGASDPPAFQINITETGYRPGALQLNTIYYWRIDEVTDEQTIAGEVWKFRTEIDHLPAKAANPYPGNGATEVESPVSRLYWEMNVLEADTAKLYFGRCPDSLRLVSAYTAPGYNPGPLHVGATYYWRVDLINKLGVVPGDLWRFTMKASRYNEPDYLQENTSDGIVAIEAEDFTDSLIVRDHAWTFVTEPGGYSGRGAMQALPDNGAFYNFRYSERSCVLNFAVDFVKTGTHYIWIRAYSRDDYDDVFHVGLDGEEITTATRIGNFQGKGQWEWLSLHESRAERRTFEVHALGVQAVNLWYAQDGATADKIVLTTNPDYVPTGLGPGSTYTAIAARPEVNVPADFELQQNYPNPFNPQTTLLYALPNDGRVRLAIYDMLGREVAILVDEFKRAGRYEVRWDATKSDKMDTSSGVYFARLMSGTMAKSIKLVVIK